MCATWLVNNSTIVCQVNRFFETQVHHVDFEALDRLSAELQQTAARAQVEVLGSETAFAAPEMD